MKEDAYFEKLKNEYVNEYCSTHGGNFTKKDIEDGFTDGFYNYKPRKIIMLLWHGRQGSGTEDTSFNIIMPRQSLGQQTIKQQDYEIYRKKHRTNQA